MMQVTLSKMGSGFSQEQITLFEGKSMMCKLPMSKIESSPSTEIKDLINHCSGPLKESIYEYMIQKLYGLIINNLGDVVEELERTVALSLLG